MDQKCREGQPISAESLRGHLQAVGTTLLQGSTLKAKPSGGNGGDTMLHAGVLPGRLLLPHAKPGNAEVKLLGWRVACHSHLQALSLWVCWSMPWWGAHLPELSVCRRELGSELRKEHSCPHLLSPLRWLRPKQGDSHLSTCPPPPPKQI